MGSKPPESRVHRTMNNFAIMISYTVVVLTLFLEVHLSNITSLIYQEKVSQQSKLHLHQSNIPLLKCTGHYGL
jgi:hypothetical protein